MLVSLLLTSVFAQTNDISKIGLYKWKEAVFIKPCDIGGSDLSKPEIISKSGQKFRVLKVIDGAMEIIQILDYTESAPSDQVKKYQPTTDFFKYNFSGTTEDFNRLTADQVNSRNYGEKQAYFKVGTACVDQLAT